MVASQFYCPGKYRAMGNIVVSLTCTTYRWATLITFCTISQCIKLKFQLNRCSIKEFSFKN